MKDLYNLFVSVYYKNNEQKHLFWKFVNKSNLQIHKTGLNMNNYVFSLMR